jgi:Cys-tRNA(Pro)/Cys-tRNA(Cys) deacylase
MKKTYPTYIDETAQLYDEIYFSAGRRGAQIILDPDKLCEVTGAEYADITKV